jgi:gluconokinase
MPQISLAEAEAPLILALDLGTSSFRALLYDGQARMVAESELQLRYELRTTPDGGAEVAASDLFDLIVKCVDAAMIHAADRDQDIVAVGTACFWHSLLGLDRNGHPVTPVYYWGDRRSGHQVAALRAELDGAAVHQRTGCVLHSSYWPAKLRWLRETDAERFARVARWCSFGDYVTRMLHGIDVTSVAMATGTGLLDLRCAIWDDEMVGAAGVAPATLPPLVDRSHAAKGLRPPFSTRWPALKDVPWYPAIGDGACANVGCGAVTPRRAALTVGTSAAIRIVVPHELGEALEIPRDLWAYRLDERHVVFGGALSNGGNVIDWLRDLTGARPDRAALIAAGELAADGHGLTMLPFLSGERSPIWSDTATGVIAGLTQHTAREHLLRAGMEAVAYRLALLYENLHPLATPRHEIVANGGAVLGSPAFMGIIADTLDHPLIPLPRDEEASARGAAVLALESAGVIPSLEDAPDPADGCKAILPDPARAAIYRAGRDRQAHLEKLLMPNGVPWSESLA